MNGHKRATSKAWQNQENTSLGGIVGQPSVSGNSFHGHGHGHPLCQTTAFMVMAQTLVSIRGMARKACRQSAVWAWGNGNPQYGNPTWKMSYKPLSESSPSPALHESTKEDRQNKRKNYACHNAVQESKDGCAKNAGDIFSTTSIPCVASEGLSRQTLSIPVKHFQQESVHQSSCTLTTVAHTLVHMNPSFWSSTTHVHVSSAHASESTQITQELRSLAQKNAYTATTPAVFEPDHGCERSFLERKMGTARTHAHPPASMLCHLVHRAQASEDTQKTCFPLIKDGSDSVAQLPLFVPLFFSPCTKAQMPPSHMPHGLKNTCPMG
eukprot:1146653-Pelagomonas_calceolata.AAC.4